MPGSGGVEVSRFGPHGTTRQSATAPSLCAGPRGRRTVTDLHGGPTRGVSCDACSDQRLHLRWERQDRGPALPSTRLVRGGRSGGSGLEDAPSKRDCAQDQIHLNLWDLRKLTAVRQGYELGHESSDGHHPASIPHRRRRGASAGWVTRDGTPNTHATAATASTATSAPRKAMGGWSP